MCLAAAPLFPLSRPADPPEAAGPDHPAAAAGSRRRRLWDLDKHAHCPVVGLCLPIDAMRRLADKVLGGQALADDYELHCGVVSECRQRNRLSEAVQKALDQRFALELRRTAALKSTEALAEAWARALDDGTSVAGMFWAVVTHPRCSPLLEEQVLGQVHMLQHQAGMARRDTAERLDAVMAENRVLARALAQAQQRCTEQAEAASRRLAQQEAALVRARADLIGRDTALAQLRERLAALEAAAPQLASRQALAEAHRAQAQRLQDLQRALDRARQDAGQQRARAEAAEAALAGGAPATAADAAPGAAMAVAPSAAPPAPAAAPLGDRAVLCVGGRAASVPVYRQLVEDTGGRFLHHDGGEEHAIARLDATLAAADLVICQTGCISHDAYWRVKEHCRRTGKRCVFVETPSRHALARALQAVGGGDGGEAAAARPGEPVRGDAAR